MVKKDLEKLQLRIIESQRRLDEVGDKIRLFSERNLKYEHTKEGVSRVTDSVDYLGPSTVSATTVTIPGGSASYVSISPVKRSYSYG